MDTVFPITPRRVHLTRLMAIWRSAGWPCRDAIELDLLAAGWARPSHSPEGFETIRLTEAGIRLLAESRQRSQRALSLHDQLALRMAAQLMAAGRIVWHELSLRARVAADGNSVIDPALPAVEALWADDEPLTAVAPPTGGKAVWRMARPDVFSVRNTTVESYLQPMVHEVKVSRADLLSDLRHGAKRESYQWLSCETYYVFPAGLAEPDEIPEAFGVWLLDGTVESGALVLARPAKHAPCKLPFFVWMALAKATPVRLEPDGAQGQLGSPVGLASALPIDAPQPLEQAPIGADTSDAQQLAPANPAPNPSPHPQTPSLDPSNA